MHYEIDDMDPWTNSCQSLLTFNTLPSINNLSFVQSTKAFSFYSLNIPSNISFCSRTKT